MAEISGFHNSVNGDRRVKADFFARFFGSLIGNGVFPNPSTSLQVIANGDMTVTVKAGKGWVNGVFYENTSDKIITLDVADGVLKRIDRIVVSDITLERDTYIKVKKGSFASTPAAPALQRDADAHELGLADIYIVNGAVSITQANITDLRLNSVYCGIVHGVVDQVDTTTLFNQYQAWLSEMKIDAETEFYEWLETLQNILSGDVAGNLLNLINDNTSDIAVHTTAIASKVDKSDYIKSPGYAVATGTANTYTVTLDPAPITYVDGMGVITKVNILNTGASTINVNGLGAKSIVDSKGNAMTSGKLKANTPYTMRYNGTNFILQGEGASGNATASDLISGKTASVDAGDIVGTMANRGAVSITPSVAQQSILVGYHNGGGVVKAIEFRAGEYVLGSVLASKSNQATYYQKMFSITIGLSGVVRVKFTLQNQYTVIRGRIFINGVAVGIERRQTSGATEYAQDFTVNIGDNIALYCYCEYTSGVYSAAANFKICSDINYVTIIDS